MVLTRVEVVHRPDGIYIFGGFRTVQGKRTKKLLAGAIRPSQVESTVRTVVAAARGNDEPVEAGRA